ncbi:MAG: hypothetical protein AAF715_06060 [Myxococcota bacterium]
MSPLFVTDANSLASTPADAPFPVWSELFAYYSDDVGEILTWGSLEVVRSRDWSKKDREIDRYGRRIPFFPFVDQVKLSKTPGQGEFDSLHLAPSMEIHPVPNGMSFQDSENYPHGFLLPKRRVRASDIGADRVSMAPFCTHDCLHTHWRWGTELSNGKRPVFGFNNSGAKSIPYQVVGNPQVHPWHDVVVTMTSEASFLYRCTLTRPPDDPIPAFFINVVNHHGSGYVTKIARRGMYRALIEAVDELSIIRIFSRGKPLRATESMAYFYWILRWTHPPNPLKLLRIVERVQLTPTQLVAARKL